MSIWQSVKSVIKGSCNTLRRAAEGLDGRDVTMSV